MIPKNLPADTTPRSFFESVLPEEHALHVPGDAGAGSVTVRLLGGPSFRLDAAGSTLTVTEVRDGERAAFLLTVPFAMAEHFLADWKGPRTLVPTFEPRGIVVATDARLIRRVAMVSGSIQLELDGFEAGRATLKAAVGKRDADDPADVEVHIGMETFKRMMNGEIAPDEAIVDGHVTVTGKRLVAMQFALALCPFFPPKT
jgi:putative sterol carrier protein